VQDVGDGFVVFAWEDRTFRLDLDPSRKKAPTR